MTRKFRKIIILLTVVSLLFSLCSCSQKKKKQPDYSPLQIEMVKFFSYDGSFVEDGSDETVSGVAAVTIKNNTEKAYELVKIEVTSEKESYSFVVTALLPGMTVTALETNRKTVSGKTDGVLFKITESAEYVKKPSLCSDKFSTDIDDGVINLKNISDRDFDEDVYVYYKNKNDSDYLGGITYRLNFGAMKKGSLSQRSSNHLEKDSTEILYITYGE